MEREKKNGFFSDITNDEQDADLMKNHKRNEHFYWSHSFACLDRQRQKRKKQKKKTKKIEDEANRKKCVTVGDFQRKIENEKRNLEMEFSLWRIDFDFVTAKRMNENEINTVETVSQLTLTAKSKILPCLPSVTIIKFGRCSFASLKIFLIISPRDGQNQIKMAAINYTKKKRTEKKPRKEVSMNEWSQKE